MKRAAVCLLLWLLNSLLLIDGFLVRDQIVASRPRAHHGMPFALPDDGAKPQTRERQFRRKPRNRHPRGYWQDIENVKTELCQFWTNLGVTPLEPASPPIIPNETLLNHFGRNDLRYVIVYYGGRKSLSACLGGASIMSGRWSVAVETPELQQVLRNATHGLSPHLPPLSPQQKKHQRLKETMISKERNKTRWNHQEGRKPKGYWTMELVIQGL